MDKIYLVDLTESERSQFITLVKRGAAPAYRIRNAQILLSADINAGDGDPPKTDAAIASYLHCHSKTVSNVRKRFVEQGLERALGRKPRDTLPTPLVLDGEKEAWLIALACSTPPEGRTRWTLQLLADTLVELEIVDTISIKTVERTLKKRAPGTYKKTGGYSPAENGNVVAAMEDVLAVYQRPYDPAQPVICMDEQPIQLHAEVREPIPAQPGRPERQDYEYRRNGVACGFMFTEPLGLWRRIAISETRTEKDWAHQILDVARFSEHLREGALKNPGPLSPNAFGTTFDNSEEAEAVLPPCFHCFRTFWLPAQRGGGAPIGRLLLAMLADFKPLLEMKSARFYILPVSRRLGAPGSVSVCPDKGEDLGTARTRISHNRRSCGNIRRQVRRLAKSLFKYKNISKNKKAINLPIFYLKYQLMGNKKI